ncbi:MAG: 1-(5-phosphoribosyl)-5-((5-phosphoribosylamino)methylideneamino)imidazole-4-carboxamide isomerase [Gemmatimonadetes bacterium]|nr:1-(5-phosphoribosyl)-5-((5-phosphoribosylamino)methylideneamino)imidazole-4-carboxamide isomerase [Gemmatimonadota bacterium]
MRAQRHEEGPARKLARGGFVLVIPALDLYGGRCVQTAGGRRLGPEAPSKDPVAVARVWAQLGFPWLHVVDMDAAMGCGSNAHVVRELLREVDVEVLVGGGIRSGERIEELLAGGAGRVVVGTRAHEDRWWLEEMAGQFAQQLVVACDVRDRRLVTHGWTRATSRAALDAIDDLNALTLGAILLTAIRDEGGGSAADMSLIEDVGDSSSAPVFVGANVESLSGLRALADRGVAACVVGSPLSNGTLDARVVAEEFGE